MTYRNSVLLGVAVGVLTSIGMTLTGCSDQTKEAASNTASGVAQDTANHAAAAGQVVTKTGDAAMATGQKAADATNKAVDATGKAVVQTGEAVKDTAVVAGKAVGDTAKVAGKAVGDTAKVAGKAVGDTAKVAGKDAANVGKATAMTPTVKAALMKTDLDTSKINVDTIGSTDTIVLKGTVKSAAQKTQAAQTAMAAIKGAGETYKVKNELTVAP